MKNKREIGITLVALVITIIILLILAGITISQLSGSGLFEKAKIAKEIDKEARDSENNKLSDYDEVINNLGNISFTRGENELPKSSIISNAIITVRQDKMDLIINLEKTTTTNISNLLGILFVNDKLYKGFSFEEINNNQIKITSIKSSSKYNIQMLIVDENGGFIRTNKADVTTSDSEFSWKVMEYPLLTKTGMKNMVYSDQYGNINEYKKDLSQGNCTAEDSLPKGSWDGNKSTSTTTGTWYWKVDQEMIGELFTYNMYWQSGCSSKFTFCDENKNELSNNASWGSDESGSKTIPTGTVFIKWWTNGHYLYEVPNPDA